MGKYLYFFIYVGLAILTRNTFWFSDLSVNNDASQHLIGFLKDPFSPHDITPRFSLLIQPIFYKYSYVILTKFFKVKSAIIFFDLLRLVIGAIYTQILVNKFINRFKRNNNYIVLKSIFIISILYLWVIVTGNIGMSRSLASIFLMAFYVHWVNFQYSKMAIVVVLSSGFYPTICVLLLTLSFIEVLLRFVQRKLEHFPSLLLIGACVIASIIMIGHSKKIERSIIGGNKITRQDILNNPVLGSEGRISIKPFVEHPFLILKNSILRPPNFNFSVYKRLFKLMPFLDLILKAIWFVLLVIIAFSTIKYLSDNFIQKVSIILSAGIFLYLLACYFPFHLYLPDRYLTYTFSFFTLIATSLLIIISDLNIIYRGLWVLLIFENIHYQEDDYAKGKVLYHEINKHIAPLTFVISNDIFITNMIPYFSGRSVFLSHENMHAVYFKNYREIQEKAILQTFNFFSATDSAQIKKLTDKLPIGGVLISENWEEINRQISAPFKNKFKFTFNPQLLDYLENEYSKSRINISGKSYVLYYK